MSRESSADGTRPPPPPLPRAGTNERSVLVVDDDPAFARATGRVLEAGGYKVTLAPDGNAAVEAIMGGSFDVIVSDIQMPGMSGVDLLRVVRAYDLDVPLILMTGDPQLETAVEAVSLGAMQYLTKPVPKDVLLPLVERASRLHRMAQMKRDSLRLLGETDNAAGDRAGLEASFERALDSLWMALQPIVDPRTRAVFGYEALMRSDEPSLPHPGAVLSAAERLDRLPDLGRRVRRAAVTAFDGAPTGTGLFVNLHTRDLLDDDLYASDAPLTKIAGRVILEVTERSTIDDIRDVPARVRRLRDRGFRIAIDDLGAGYAGLSSFVALEPDIVKLDMSLVRGSHLSDVRQRLIASMTGLSREMGMRVVAEGVEVVEERDCVMRCGCDLLQGYLFAKPARGLTAPRW
jgi:EAL domain-containing protein (putative c-di-GMP-specific phosphodiesterase class I)